MCVCTYTRLRNTLLLPYIFHSCPDLRYTFARQSHMGNLHINVTTEQGISEVGCRYAIQEGWQTQGQCPLTPVLAAWHAPLMARGLLKLQPGTAPELFPTQLSRQTTNWLELAGKTKAVFPHGERRDFLRQHL